MLSHLTFPGLALLAGVWVWRKLPAWLIELRVALDVFKRPPRA